MSERPSYLLLVEDHPGDAGLTQEFLAEYDGEQALPPLRWVQSLAAALETLDKLPGCTAVLLDLGLPDSDGMNALRAIRAQHADLPVIVLSGHDSMPMSLDALSSGAQDYVVKDDLSASGLQRAVQLASHRKRMEVAARARLLLDDLTGLPRRVLLLDHLNKAMVHAHRSGASGALLFIDLDGFKQVNDLHGHQAGDAVLVGVAQRLLAAVRVTDTVARLGGDEFVALLYELADPGHARLVADKLLRAIEQPIAWQAARLQVSASIGLTFFGSGPQDAAALLGQADRAMYQAKATGKGRVVEL
ncbi:MAG: hypothetical protein RIQ60_1825 [Pseudomonadota bacterium]|jgi:diguanylate cyclase (GGDEF)-like protein